MNHHEATLERILRTHGLPQCPTCHTPITAANVGWNTEPDFGEWFSGVFILCTQYPKYVKRMQVAALMQPRGDAIDALNDAV
jgi:hypothetical protein